EIRVGSVQTEPEKFLRSPDDPDHRVACIMKQFNAVSAIVRENGMYSFVVDDVHGRSLLFRRCTGMDIAGCSRKRVSST
ncbi:MAG: hypothetical protein WCW40_08095, partial [Bacteroidota bacterium]